MKAAVMTEIKKPLVVQQVEDPKPEPDDVIVKVGATGVCRSDWHFWQGDWSWVGLSPHFPHILGHEMAGTVAEVGSNVHNVKVGQRVVVPFDLGCGHCRQCVSGHSNVCENQVAFGFTINGSYAEYVRVPYADFNVVPLPDEISFTTAASLGCRYMTAFHGVIDRVQVRPGEWFAVFGTGGVGMAATQIAASIGARVIACDIDDQKLNMAKEIGATATVNTKNKQPQEIMQEIMGITGGGADCTLDALGIAATCVPAILSLRTGGRHLQIGLTSSDQQGIMPIPSDVVVFKEATILGSLGMQAYRYSDLLGLVASGRLHPEQLISRTIPIEEAGNTLEAMTNFATMGTVVVDRF
ncbi:MAG: zinc-dependent alcohol dehydrogenase family protein [Firmicutes bacterium]|nr:zinc-dependent alcohol dehydrogenase family protein [Bacillota bacterium]